MDETSFNIEVLSDKNWYEVMPLIATSFVPREPITQGLHATFEDMAHFLVGSIHDWLDSGASIGLRDIKTSKLVGVLLCAVLTRDQSNAFNNHDIFTIKERDLVDVLDMVHNNVNVFEDDQVTKVYDIAILTVNKEYNGRGLAAKLIQAGEEHGASMGCEIATAQLTNFISQKIFGKLDYNTRYILDITTLQKDGKPMIDVTAMNGTTVVTGVTKKI